MNEFNEQTVEQQSRTLNAILREDFGWQTRNFVDGMAKINVRSFGKPVKLWEPRLTFLEKAVVKIFTVEPRIPSIKIDEIVQPGVYLKFLLPDQKMLTSMDAVAMKDMKHWVGFFVRESDYSIDWDVYDEEQHGNIPFVQWEQNRKEGVEKWDGSHLLFGRWVRFRDYDEGMPGNDFTFTIDFVDAPIRARIPTLVLFGAEWIRVASVN